MSGAKVAKKVDKAMTKVGKKIGFPCTVYRPDSYANPLQDKNIHQENVNIAFSVDAAFARNPIDDLTHMQVYASSDVIQVGDIVVCTNPPASIVIESLDPIRTPSGIMANDRMDLYRSVYTPLADKKTSLQLVGEKIPCAVRYGSVGVSIQNANMSGGKSTVEIWTWMPVSYTQFNDVVEVRGVRYTVNAMSATDKGTRITAVSTESGK